MIRSLTPEEISARDAGLELAARLAGVPAPMDIQQVQALYDALLAEGVYEGEASIAAGLALGALIAAQGEFEWVRISDEFGDETVLSPPGKDIHCAPISMIQKRLQRRENVDLACLRDGVIQTIHDRIDRVGNR